MDLSKHDADYQARVSAAIDGLICPECGKPAVIQAIGWSDTVGCYMVAPIYSCDTEGCEFSVEGPSAWIPALLD